MRLLYRLLWLTGLLAVCVTYGFAQLPAADTNVFTLEQLKGLVLLNHPIVKQAALLNDEALAKVMQALGKFDPKLEAAFARKEFGNTDYYNNFESGLKIPLWVAGADLKLGFDRNVGEFTNPQYRTGDDGLTGLGLSIPIGQGLLIDARRNTLRQSKIMVRYAEAEKIKQIIGVWFDAVRDYWTWFYTYNQYKLMRNGVDLAKIRYEAIRAQTELGDKPPIDSVEASITVQDREIQLAKLTVELENARLLLSNHIWDANEQPMELSTSLVPEADSAVATDERLVALDSLLEKASGNHPDLRKLWSKRDGMIVEQQYRREQLKPTLNLTGSLLTSRNTFGNFYPEYYDLRWQNYKVGLDFSFPLFLRAERGKLKEIKLQRQELEYGLKQTEREIRNNIYTSYNTLTAYREQLNLQVASINNQQKLLTAETQKFELGESTLFLINSRETKLIEMQAKRAQLIADFQKKLAELYYKAGTMQANEM